MIGPFPLATIPPEDEALRPEIRAFLRETVAALPPERRARSWMGFAPDFSRKLAERGWLGLTFPKEYGGAGGGGLSRPRRRQGLGRRRAPGRAGWAAGPAQRARVLTF